VRESIGGVQEWDTGSEQVAPSQSFTSFQSGYLNLAFFGEYWLGADHITCSIYEPFGRFGYCAWSCKHIYLDLHSYFASRMELDGIQEPQSSRGHTIAKDGKSSRKDLYQGSSQLTIMM
jgi:hypothetical protein